MEHHPIYRSIIKFSSPITIMAKKTRSDTPSAESPKERPFSKKNPPIQSIERDVQTVSRAEAVEVLKSLGKGWSKEVEAILAMPDRLYSVQEDDGRYFSRDESFGIFGAVAAMPLRGRMSVKSDDYGIAIYGSAGKIFVLLLDMGRRIAVKETLYCIHDKPPEKDWGVMASKIKSAASTATALKGNKAVLSDQGTDVIDTEG
jgi:hypothetical protein